MNDSDFLSSFLFFSFPGSPQSERTQATLSTWEFLKFRNRVVRPSEQSRDCTSTRRSTERMTVACDTKGHSLVLRSAATVTVRQAAAARKIPDSSSAVSQPAMAHAQPAGPIRSPATRTCAREGIHRSGGWRRKKGEVLVEGDDERKKKKKKNSDGMDDDQIPPSALRTLLLPPLHSETMIIPDYASLIAGTLCCCSCFSFFFFSPPNLSYQVLLFYCDSRIAKCFSFLPVKRNRIIF